MHITLGKYKITSYLSADKEIKQVVYLHMPEGGAEAVWNLTKQDFALIVIEGVDWNRELTPWRHEKVFPKGEDFSGKADDYLAVLTGQLIPQIESACYLRPDKRYLAGYSLGGLFAAYAMYQTSLFNGIASISGSLWYEGFLDYVKNHTLGQNPDKIYFSLGDKEAASARGIMQSVFVCTKQIVDLLQDDERSVIFEMNEGNHFKQVPERIARGISRLLSDL
ncbi:MAG: alpha/beta hydrolase-fold protein [Clostridium sp.]|nr:alpha/beta hydrolase-fold protein [Clostridium sp.]